MSLKAAGEKWGINRCRRKTRRKMVKLLAPLESEAIALPAGPRASYKTGAGPALLGH